MRIELNGDAIELADGASVADAIDATGAKNMTDSRRGIAVAVDGEVVPRGEWGATPLADGQSIEVVGAIQGG